VKSSLRREPDVPGDLLRAIFGNVTEPQILWEYVIEVFRIELETKVGQKRYREAYNLIERVVGRIPRYLESDLKKDLATAIRFDPMFHDPELTRWASDQ
jgi:hypothetical protein